MPPSSRVLVVGHSLTINAIRKISLEQADYEVVAVLGISDALEAANRSRFDVAVVDGYFPSDELRKL